MKVGGNPQERLLAYVAGIIDGEGTISVHYRQKKKNNRKDGNSLTPFISIANTDIRILHQCRKLFQLLGASNHTIYRKRDSKRLDKKDFTLRVAGAKSVKIVLEKLTWYLIAKKRQAKLLLKLCEMMEERVKRYYEPHLNRKRIELEVSAEEIEIANKIRRLNKSRFPQLKVSSETIRQAVKKDIVQSYEKS